MERSPGVDAPQRELSGNVCRSMPLAPSRLLLLVTPALLLTAMAVAASAALLPTASPWLSVLVALLLVVSYGRMTLTTFSALLGMVPRRRADALPCRAVPQERIRTALVLPIYNEPSAPIAAAVRILSEALDAEDDVTVFILSDTQNPLLVLEEAAWFPAHAISGSGVEVNYRRRLANSGRKAGNIAEFCHNAGRDHDFAIILDADSLMTAQAIRDLILSLRHEPRTGLIQSVSYLIGGDTLFARMQQFAARLNTPLSVAGQHLWQGRRGTFWGHNAILRLAPFTRHAELPVLPGRAPMGGEILCHDTIEAALLLRAGWEVRLAPEIVGSYETTPSNLIDHLARERRWCQGNLQHLRLIGGMRLRPESRMHIGIGILHYLSSPVSLLVSIVLLANSFLIGPASRHDAPPAHLAGLLLWLTVFLLFAPRLASLGRALLLDGAARGFGGRMRLLASALIEQAMSMLLSPILMVSATGFVISTFLGRVVVWNAPSRGDRSVGWREAWQRLRWHSAVGIAVAGLLALEKPSALPWAMPFLLGLILSIPVAVGSASVRLGRLARRAGLFLTEDELMPTVELAAMTSSAATATVPARVPTPWPSLPTTYPAEAVPDAAAE